MMSYQDTENGVGRCKKKIIIFFFHKYIIQRYNMVMKDFNFDTTDISTAIDLMRDADRHITNEFEIEFKSRFSSSKSIDWKDYALGKRR